MELAAVLGEWRSTMRVSGGKCAVITGAMKQRRWCVRNSTAVLQNVSKKSSTMVIAIGEVLQRHALARSHPSPSALFNSMEGRAKGFRFHVQVRHKGRAAAKRIQCAINLLILVFKVCFDHTYY